MKTIKQIADEIGVSKQAVQKRLSREPLYTSTQPYIHTKQGTKYIDEQGEKLIISAFNGKVYTKVADNVHIDETDNHVYTLIATLQEQLQIKDRQISDLQKSNGELTAALENTTASLQAAQALHAGTMHKQLAEPPPGGGAAAVEVVAEQPEQVEESEPPRRNSWWRFGRKK